MSTLAVSVEPVRSFGALEAAWRELETDAAPVPLFRSWTWVGCLAEERYPDPVLLRAATAGRTVGLALFNRRRGWLALTESGERTLDAPFVEHNAPLLAADAGPEVLPAMLRAAWRVGGVRGLVLSGVPRVLADAAGGVAFREQVRIAPFVDLDAVRAAGGDPLETLSANTRYQIRRSLRRYAELGAVVFECAKDEPTRLEWLDAMIALHTRSWQARGKPGAFADPFMRRFHRTLIARAAARDEVELLRLSAGTSVLGHLYNFRAAGHVAAYQSGFAPEAMDSHRKSGLLAHTFAIRAAAERGDRVYDFLAGADRYKLSLASGTAELVWSERVPAWSWRGFAVRIGRRRG